MEATKLISFITQVEREARTLGGGGIDFVSLFSFMTCALHLQCYLDIKAASFHLNS